MDFAFNEQEAAVQEAARALVRKLLPRAGEWRHRLFHDKQLPPELWQAFADSGFLGALIPEAYGGSGLGLTALAIAMEELGSVGLSNALLILTAMDGCCILRHGTEEQKRRFLPAIARGELKLCFALTEPDAGSNTFRIRTRASLQPDGSYRLDGEKVFITGADQVDRMLVVVRTTPHEEAARGPGKAWGLSLFLVDARAAGIEKHPLPMRGIEGFRQFRLVFDNVAVAESELLGERDQGALALFQSLNPERILAAATCCGTVRFLLDRATGYARERKVFGDRPIGAYQAIAHPLAEVRALLEAARLLTLRAAWSFDREEGPAVTGAHANAAKLFAADLGIKAADAAIETLGGYGFSEEYGVIHAWEAMRLLKTAPVSREMILNFFAEHLLELPRSY